MKRAESALLHRLVVSTPTVWEEKWKWQSSRKNRMLTFKGLPSASPIPRASKLSAKCVVVVTRPHTSKTCLVWENFTICYEYWIWIRPINDGYVTIRREFCSHALKEAYQKLPLKERLESLDVLLILRPSYRCISKNWTPKNI